MNSFNKPPIRKQEIKGEKIENTTETFSIEGENIAVSTKEFSPNMHEETPRDEVFVFLPGWSAGGAKTLEDLTQQFSQESGKNAFSITTRAENVIPDSLNQEAKAIRELFLKKGIKKVILAGHSEGGSKAADLIALLQKENPDVEVEGLILLSPVGLYQQGQGDLVKAFAKDSMVNTPATIMKNIVKDPKLAIKALQASSDIIFNIAKEIKESGTEYPERMRAVVAELAKENKQYAEIKCPVVLIQGGDDPVSSHEKVISSEEDPKTLSGRRKILRETFFPNSPQVDMLVPSKLGHHGQAHFRSEEIAKTSLYMLKRFNRKEKESIS